MHVSVKEKITEGIVRAEMDGCCAERRVMFTGEPIMLDLVLVAE